jgi:hypothetical protein
MTTINEVDRDTHLRAVIKSNLVCGNYNDIDKMVDDLTSDIIDVLDNYDLLKVKDEI